MKKLLLTILCVLICPLAVSAVNYVQISKNIESAVFVDNDSISVIRYAPPYYVIQCDERIHSFTMGKWAQITSQYLYDYDNQIIKKRYVSMKARKEDSSWSNPFKYTKIANVSKYQVNWWVANYIFTKAYNMYFSPEMQAEYGAKHT